MISRQATRAAGGVRSSRVAKDDTAFRIYDPRAARARVAYATVLTALSWFIVPARMAWTTHLLVEIGRAHV